MNNLKYIYGVFLVTFLLIGFGVIFNYIIDPFQQYRKPILYKAYFSNGRNLNSGLIKQYNPKSIILGTSMTENFILSNVHTILKYDKPIKLVIVGSSAYEESLTLEYALSQGNIKSVLFGVDYYSFKFDTDEFRFGDGAFPIHLYNNIFLDDYLYLVSFDMLKESVMCFAREYLKSANDPWFHYNTMYQRKNEHSLTYGEKEVLEQWKLRHSAFDKKTLSNEQIQDLITRNINQNILPHIRNNPETDFVFFYPPYSILAYKYMVDKNELNSFLFFRKQLFDTLKKYKNIKIYDFQVADNITHNLELYKDISHYKQEVNRWMLEQITEQHMLVTESNVDMLNELLVKQVKNYNIPD